MSAFFPSLSVCANFITGNPPSFHSPTNSAGTCTHAGPPSFNTPSVKCYFSPFNFHLPAQLIAYVCHVKIPSAYECLLNRYCSLQHDSFRLITNLSIRFIVLTFLPCPLPPTQRSPLNTVAAAPSRHLLQLLTTSQMPPPQRLNQSAKPAEYPFLVASRKNYPTTWTRTRLPRLK